ncbi:hypothetical protein FRC15_008221 [Serendipita sp. 397]|nr:hypothetical protein FRC15_008221 [Serendipita sp. 397]
MIVGLGTDILNTLRLQAFSLNRLSRLSKRILTAKEFALMQDTTGFPTSSSLHAPFAHQSDEGFRVEAVSRFLGVRWAAKEAIYKALYPHYVLTWKDVEALPISMSKHRTGKLDSAEAGERQSSLWDPNPSSGKLQLRFTKSLCINVNEIALSKLNIHMSISHDNDMVVATVLVEGE